MATTPRRGPVYWFNRQSLTEGASVTIALQDDHVARVTDQLAQTLGSRRFTMWFDQSARFDYEPSRQALRVAVPNRFVANRIERQFHQALSEAISQQLGDQVQLELEVDPSRFVQGDEGPAGECNTPETPAGEQGSADASASPGASAATAPARAHAGARNGQGSRAAAPMRHRLDDFVVGPSNQLAYAAANRLTADEAAAGQPLFIHGGCGMGKTHLLQGLCRKMQHDNPQARVLYTTGERFTNEYITAVRANKLDAFRQRIRQLDLLAVDDVHFIANKQATQQEFLHSFNEIELGGARLALASDSHPKMIEQFSEALVNRFVHGLVVQINEPDAETRRRLVSELAQRRGLTLQSAAVDVLAGRCTGSVREIEGLLTKLHALATLGNGLTQRDQPIGRAVVDQLLGTQAQRGPSKPVDFTVLRDTVAEHVGVGVKQVLGSSRQKHVVLARAVLIHLARELTAMSFPEIARAMGRTNHSTVITAAKRLSRQMQSGETTRLPGQLEAVGVNDLVEQIKRALSQTA
jgi:chromosomal replication initiator protein